MKEKTKTASSSTHEIGQACAKGAKDTTRTLHYLDGRLPVNLGYFTPQRADFNHATATDWTYDASDQTYYVAEHPYIA